MIIRKIRLQNITTHIDTTVEFYNGVNILMGENGTGKSTVLTMIGFVLFNYLPGKQDNYVRNSGKQKWGLVSLWFIGNDNKHYCIKRGIGKASHKIEVYVGEEEVKLQKINSVDNLLDFLKSTIGIQNFDLSTIFENAIGVQQGMFTAPFLARASDRKKIFAPLLKVEIYNQIYLQYRKINKEFENQIKKKEILIGTLTGNLLDKPELIQEIDQLKIDIDENIKKLSTLVKTFKDIDEKYKKLKKVKDDLQTAQQLCATLQLKVNNKRQNVSKLEIDIKEAKKAQKLCSETKKDFDIFNQLSEKQSDLQKKNKQRMQIEEAYNGLIQKKKVVSTQIEELSKNITEIDNLKQDFEKLTGQKQEFENLESKINILNEKKIKIGSLCDELNNLQEKNTPIIDQMKEIQRELQILPQLEKEITQMDSIRKKQIEISNDIATCQMRIKDLQNNLDQAKEGKCPLCKQDYHVPGKSLSESFLEEIKEKEKKRGELQKKLDLNMKKESELKQKQEHVEILHKKDTTWKELKKILSENKKQIKQIKDRIVDKDEIEKTLKSAIKKRELLEPTIKRYHILNNKLTKDLPSYTKRMKDLQAELNKIQEKFTPLKEKLQTFSEIVSMIDKNQEKMNQTRKNHDIYQRNLTQGQKLQKFEQEIKKEQNALKDIQKNLETDSKKKEQLESKYNKEEFQQLENKRDSFKENKIHLEEEIKQMKITSATKSKKLKKLTEIESDLKIQTKKLEKLNLIDNFSKTIRNWFKESEPKITAALMREINETASDLYRRIKDEQSVRLEWLEDYNVNVYNADFPPRAFIQLSGGEQMAVALAIRLAILKVLTSFDFAFFDEPTTNLDEHKRTNLAQCIERIKGFKQLFIISHDDTFEENSDHVIKFIKNESEETTVEFPGQVI